MEYIYHIIILMILYSILTISLNIIVGFTGILSIAHAAFYGIGAYVAAILTQKFSFPFFGAIVVAGTVACFFGGLIGWPSFRIKGDYLLIATLGFGEIVRSILINSQNITGGPIGLIGIPKAHLFGWKLDTSLEFLSLCIIFFVIIIFISFTIQKSQFGRILMAIKDDETAVITLGKNTLLFKIKALMIGTFFAGIAGSLYAHYVNYIDPSTFTVAESILIFCMLILGGLGNIWGSILGAVLLVFFPEMLKFIGLPSTIAATVRQMLYGLILIVLMMYRPQGLVGKIWLK